MGTISQPRRSGGDPLTAIREKAKARRDHHASLAEVGDKRRPPRNDLSPKIPVVEVPIDKLEPARRRVRKADPVQVARVKASIEQFGFVDPILVADGRIVDGHVRFEAARELGFTALPCILVEHLTETEIRTLTLAKNRLSELGSWDIDALRIELGELIIEDAPLEVTGFAMAEIDGLLLEDPAAGDDDVFEVLEDVVTRILSWAAARPSSRPRTPGGGVAASSSTRRTSM